MTEKSISMVINDTKTNLISVCNNSGLPLCVLELIVKDIYQEIKVLSSNQLKYDEEEYQKMILEEKDVDKNNK